ncbi:MAG TPA: beta-ketoacyl synthase N-terminal-like domain-containing protein [Micromonosporaceae bacterium]|nr:beta-ketoacyl synthase N-terminal-like domain-containing protein [Micromonosporaceae bacterium]
MVTGTGYALADVACLDGLAGAQPAPVEPVDPAARLGRRGLRYLDRATQLALCAAVDALRGARLVDGDGRAVADGASVAVVVSSNTGNLGTVCRVAGDIAARTSTVLSPMDLPNASSNVTAATVAVRFGLRGPNLTLCNGPTSGLDALHWADRLVTGGRADRVLVVGVEPRDDLVARLTGVAPAQLFDGAVAVVVERDGACRQRGAPALGRLGRYRRDSTLSRCLAGLLADPELDGRPGVWFTPPEGSYGDVAAPPGVARHDLTRAVGRACGALGVLQCAAALRRFARGEIGAAVLSCGDDREAAAGLLLLSGPERRHDHSGVPAPPAGGANTVRCDE